MRLVADGNNCWLRIGDTARVKLFAADTVDDVLLRVLDARLGDGADDVGLVVFPGFIADVDINNVIGVVEPKHRVGFIPVNVMKLLGLGSAGGADGEDGDNETQTVLIHFVF